jgi:hypothetical protein
MDDNEYERIRRYVVEPLVNELKADIKAMQAAILSVSERFERQFQQHDRMLTSTEAAMRNAADPTTGSITRAEMRELNEELLERHSDHETRLRSLERNLVPPWLWPVFSVLFGGACTVATHFFWH